MFIWLGLDADDAFSRLKARVCEVDRALGINGSRDSFPFHVSFKISFEVPDGRFEEIADAVVGYYRTLHGFTLYPRAIEKEDGIVWVRYREEPYLSEIKQNLNRLLLDKFGIEMHPYDYDDLFHTTLYMDEDEEILARAFDAVKDTPLPTSVTADRFALGVSPTGDIGSYVICRTVTAE